MIASIQEAKTQVIAEKNKFTSAVRTVIGSRVLLAVLTMLMLGFGAHALYAPDRLPPIAGLDMAKSFAPTIDAGVIGQKLQEAQDAAVRQGGLDRLNDFVTAHQAQIPLYNLIGFALSALLLVGNLLAAATKWRGATGVTIGAP